MMLNALKEKAVAMFAATGLPTRQNEDWKYSSTEQLLKHDFQSSLEASGVSIASMPKGVLVLPIQEAFETQHELLTKHFGQVLKSTHGFHSQNLAFFKAGFLIHVPDGLQPSEPLVIHHKTQEPGYMQCVRHLVVLGASSSMTMVDTYESALDDAYFTNTITEVFLDQAAKLSHVKIQREGKAAFHVGEIAVKQSESSVFESHSLSFGGAFTRSDTSVDLAAPKAQCLMNGIYLPAKAQHVDHHTTVTHTAPDCVSEQDYKGILKDNARAVFNGKVIVPEGASKTEAKQYNKNVLLSPKAEVNTKPELQIFTDDVTCAHGATVGQLDEDALFYLATRGIDSTLAHQYLMRAFLTDNLRQIEALGLGEQFDLLSNINDLVTDTHRTDGATA